MQGKTINGFTLRRLLGVGGMAEVWYAENKIGKKVAVKLLLPKWIDDETLKARFENEAKVMVKLDHPNIRQVYDYLESFEGRPCIIMEYLEGKDLKTMMEEGNQFAESDLAKWWNQLVHALNYTHTLGIVHRDLKPANIFIDKRGDVHLLDFGIAKNNEGGLGTLTGTTLGTRIYMSPEQVKDPKRVDYRTDYYSLAVTFVHLITGKKPYDSVSCSDFEIQLSIVSKPLDLSGLPLQWREFLSPYLEKDTKKRPILHEYNGRVDNSFDVHVNDDDETVMEGHESGHGMGCNTSKDNNYMEYGNYGDLVFTVNGVSFVMKSVEGGSFWMGADNGQRTRIVKEKKLFGTKERKENYVDSNVPNYNGEALDSEKPVHHVTLNSFYLGETVVTQALWEAVMDTNPSYFKGDNLPVETVSWNECQEFIRKLNSLTGRSFRLPTEAEWEYAARGGKKSNGYKYAGSNSIGSVAWYYDNSGSKTHPVKGKNPNELGLYDMSGNVCEWCQDWFDRGYYGKSPSMNPKGPSSGSRRVLRGGSWYYYARFCRVSYRIYNDPSFRLNYYGFRLCLPQ